MHGYACQGKHNSFQSHKLNMHNTNTTLIKTKKKIILYGL